MTRAGDFNELVAAAVVAGGAAVAAVAAAGAVGGGGGGDGVGRPGKGDVVLVGVVHPTTGHGIGKERREE